MRSTVPVPREGTLWLVNTPEAEPDAGPATPQRVVLSDGHRSPAVEGLSRRQVWVRFVALNLMVLVVLVALGAVLSQAAARREAVADAARLTDTLALSVVQPSLRPGLVDGDPGALAALDAVVRARVLSTDLVRIKIWARDGTVVYSDEARLVGERFPLGEDEVAALDERLTDAELSDLSQPENRFERPFGELLEVYRPILTPEGDLLLFETYSRYASITEAAASIFRTFVPVTLGTAVLLGLAQWPLVSWMFGQMEAVRKERELLLERALEATDEERRRIVGNLHDGIVQDLTGASLLVSVAAVDARRAGDSELAARMDDAAGAVREGLRGLRSALVEIYPPALSTASLAGALEDLLAPLRGRGTQVQLEVPAELDCPPAAHALLYRVAQESVRNVAKHSRATRVEVSVVRRHDSIAMSVVDDGEGFEPLAGADGALPWAREKEDGTHVGLSLLADVAASAGARLELVSAPGAGTTVRVQVPLWARTT